MSADAKKPGGKPPTVPKVEHAERAADALRDNLRRRKAAAKKNAQQEGKD